MLRDDEDWDPTRVIAGKRRKIQRKADRKRRKIKTERELASRQADPRRLAQHIRTKNQARDIGEAKRAQVSQQEKITRQRNAQRLAQHIRTKNQARDTDEAKRAQASQQEQISRLFRGWTVGGVPLFSSSAFFKIIWYRL